MKKGWRGIALILAMAVCGPLLFAGISSAAGSGSEEKIFQSGAILTVAESKRLIGKAVAQMPVVKNALANGMVIIIKGTTNAYVAEEITGKKADHAAFVTGRIEPEKGTKNLPEAKAVNHVILEKGKIVDISLGEAAKKLKAGDVVIKGANALDYRNKMAAVNSAPGRGNDGNHHAHDRGAQGSPRDSGRPREGGCRRCCGADVEDA